MMKLAGAAVVAAFLAGCSSATMSPTSADAGPPPANYREAVKASARETFFDPYSVRDASISQPLYASTIFDGMSMVPRKGWIVCVRANAKNRMGAYTGMQETVFLFSGSTVALTLSGPSYAGQIADPAVYQPFPELEA